MSRGGSGGGGVGDGVVAECECDGGLFGIWIEFQISMGRGS